MGRLTDGGMAPRDQASLATLTGGVRKTSEIEGEQLKLESVLSSVARRLGADIGALPRGDRSVEGVFEMVLRATLHYAAPLTATRPFGCHAALFPTGYNGLTRIRVGAGTNAGDAAFAISSGGAQRAYG